MFYLKQKEYDELVQYCRKQMPNEACGIFAGQRTGEIEKIYPITNVKESPSHFLLHPKEQIAAMKNIRESGFCLLGYFHSHPQSQASPSKEDISFAKETEAACFILSLQEEPKLRVFLIGKEEKVKEDICRLIP